MISVTINGQAADLFTRRLEQLQTAVNRGLIDPALGTLPKQAQLLVERCIELTPPFAGKTGTKMEGVRARKIGENAVARDINAIIKGRDDGYLEFLTRNFGTRIERQNLKTKHGVSYVIDVDIVDQSGDQIPSFHKANRDRRGRVLIATSKSNDDKIGRWRARNRLWAPADEVKRYIKLVQGRVGSARAGWLKAFIALGGKGAPDWILRHGMRRGAFVDGMNGDKPFLAVYNQTKWGTYNDEAGRAVRKAIGDRAMRMNTYFRKMMQLAAEGKMTQWQAAQAQVNDAA